MKLSRNFSLAELIKSDTAIRKGIDNNPNPDQIDKLKVLCEKVLQPVIDQARNGIIVSYDLHNAIGSSYQLKDDPESRRIYFHNNKPVAIGSVMKRPDLANTFEYAIPSSQVFVRIKFGS